MRALIPKRLRGDPYFRWRSPEPTRLEAFSDAAFAFALTLLVVSLEVPRSADDLLGAMREIPAFAASFAILSWIWYQHYLFFQRYGITNLPVVMFNVVLLFLVLVYVYPLKFIFSAVVGGGVLAAGITTRAEAVWLYTLYSSGFLAVFAVLLALHLYAWRRADELELDAVERSITRYEIRHSWICIAIAVLSIVLAWIPRMPLFLPGFTYILLGPAHAAHGYFSGRRWPQLAAQRR